MAETKISKSFSVSGNNSTIFNLILKIMPELNYLISSQNWPDEIEFTRGKGGLLATSINDVKTILNVKLEQKENDVKIFFDYTLNIPASFLSKDDNEIEQEFNKIKNKIFEQTQKVSNEIRSQNTIHPTPETTGEQIVKTVSAEKEQLQTKPSLIKTNVAESEMELTVLKESEQQLKLQLEQVKRDIVNKDEFLLKNLNDLRYNLLQLDKFFRSLIDVHGIAMNQIFLDELSTHRKNSKLQLRIISHLLDIQKIDLDTMLLTENNYNISDIIDETIIKLDFEIKNKGINVSTNLRRDLACACDKKRIVEVLENILLNSIDFCKRETGEIGIFLTQEENNAKILISDNGIGIEVKNLEKIFDKFSQFNPTIPREVHEGGLGLAVCKGLIEGHNGKIWAESREIEFGAEIHILLPLTTETHDTIRKVK